MGKLRISAPPRPTMIYIDMLYDNEIQYRPIIFITPLFRICNPEAVSADLQSANSSALQMHG
ncbi:MAG: hypothetical protein QM610_16195, partial [Chitinophagaceae bacterium]